MADSLSKEVDSSDTVVQASHTEASRSDSAVVALGELPVVEAVHRVATSSVVSVAKPVVASIPSTKLDPEIIAFFESYMFPLVQGIHCFNFDKHPPLVAIARFEKLNIKGKSVDSVYMAEKLIAAGAIIDQQDNIKVKVYDDDVHYEEITGSPTVVARVIQAARKAGKKITGEEGGATALLKASQYGRDPMIALLLRNHARTDIPDNQGATAVFRASQNGQIGAVRQLIDAEANLHILCRGLSPLFVAIQQLRVDIVRALALGGALVGAEDKILDTATAMDLVFAKNSALVMAGKITAAQQRMMTGLLEEYGFMCIARLAQEHENRVDINHLLRGRLTCLSEEEDVRLLFTGIANRVIETYWKRVDAPSTVDEKEAVVSVAPVIVTADDKYTRKYSGGNTYLHEVAARTDINIEGYKEIFAALHRLSLLKTQCTILNDVVDTNKGPTGGIAPMHIVVKAKNGVFVVALVQFCQEQGIDPQDLRDMVDTPNVEGVTPLMYTPVLNAFDIAQQLLLAKADPNHEDPKCNTASLIAIQLNRFTYVQLFLENGATLFARDDKDMTMFDYALKLPPSSNVFNYLLGVTDRHGLNATHLFALSKCCSQCSSAVDYRSMLVRIMQIRKVAIAKRITEAELSVTDVELRTLLNTEDEHGRTPSYYAFFSGNFGFITWATNVIGANMLDKGRLSGFVAEFMGAAPLLPLAICNGADAEFVGLLLRMGVDGNELYEGNTALHFVMSPTIATLILQRKKVPAEQVTIQMKQVARQVVEIAMLLLSTPGIKTDLINDEGLTPDRFNPMLWSRLQAELLRRQKALASAKTTLIVASAVEHHSLAAVVSASDPVMVITVAEAEHHEADEHKEKPKTKFVTSPSSV